MTRFLFLIFLIGSLLRFTNLNWDSYLAFHPDERNISWAVTRIRFFDQMNPQFFAYGGLPIYLYRALGEIMVAVTHDTNWLFDWGHIAVMGRYVSAILSSISIVLIYLVSKKFFSPAVGLLSPFFLAFSPWSIREAHFATTETMLIFFLLLLLLLAHRLITGQNRQASDGDDARFVPRHTSHASRYEFRNRTTLDVLLIGIILGLAIAAKTTSVLFALIPLSTFILPFIKFQRPLKFNESLKSIIFPIFLLSTTTAIIFFLFSPFTILDWTHFKESMDYESGVALGRFPVPYTLQFLKTIPYVYQVQTMLWQAGPLAIVGLVGMIVLALSLFKKKNSPLTIFLIFPVVYFLWQGNWFAKFARYNVPLLPFMTISASWLLLAIYKRFRLAGLACIACVAGLTFFWGVMNWTIYLRPQTRVRASQWMFQNIRPDATIYTEHWNDGLPVFLPGDPVVSYHRELLNAYDTDTDGKIKTITQQLENGDFIILSTRRIWGTMPALTDRYPFTSQLYKKLLNGTSNYKEVATFTSYPSLFGITINDDAAEESVHVFDHPTVRIFKKNAL